jgi:internalin A
LISLDLSDNQLTALPEWIAQLQNLTSLDLTSNELTALPDAIVQLQNLTELHLIRNRLRRYRKTHLYVYLTSEYL